MEVSFLVMRELISSIIGIDSVFMMMIVMKFLKSINVFGTLCVDESMND